MSLNILKLAKVSAVVAVAAGIAIVANPSQAKASPWDYAVAGSGNGTGGAAYDYRGIAIKEDGNDIIVAINAGMGLQGSNYNGEIINHGDLFLNFSGTNFKAASDAGKLFGVHFATAGSQSGVSEVGLYKNVTAKNVTQQNYGWNNTTQWSNAVGGNNSYGDLKSSDSYFAGQQSGSYTILNEIKTGTKVGGLLMMNAQELAANGLNFGAQRSAKGEKADAAVTLGFRFTKTADFKAGNFIANMFAECGNDGLAITSNLTRGYKVPEPTAMAGMAVVGGMSLLRRLRRRG
jgi:hypothetical protein